MSAGTEAADLADEDPFCLGPSQLMKESSVFIDYFVCVCDCFCMHIRLNMERLCSFRVRRSNNVGDVSVRTDVALFVLRLARPEHV